MLFFLNKNEVLGPGLWNLILLSHSQFFSLPGDSWQAAGCRQGWNLPFGGRRAYISLNHPWNYTLVSIISTFPPSSEQFVFIKHLLLCQILTVTTVLKCFFAEMQRIFPVSSAACQTGWLLPAGGVPSNQSVFRRDNTCTGSAVQLGSRRVCAWVHKHIWCYM